MRRENSAKSKGKARKGEEMEERRWMEEDRDKREQPREKSGVEGKGTKGRGNGTFFHCLAGLLIVASAKSAFR